MFKCFEHFFKLRMSYNNKHLSDRWHWHFTKKIKNERRTFPPLVTSIQNSNYAFAPLSNQYSRASHFCNRTKHHHRQQNGRTSTKQLFLLSRKQRNKNVHLTNRWACVTKQKPNDLKLAQVNRQVTQGGVTLTTTTDTHLLLSQPRSGAGRASWRPKTVLLSPGNAWLLSKIRRRQFAFSGSRT